MGNTAEQHRAAIGSFAGRIASSGWASKSSSFKNSFTDLKEYIILCNEGVKTRKSLAHFLLSTVLTAVVLCFGPPLVIQAVHNGFTNEPTFSGLDANANHINPPEKNLLWKNQESTTSVLFVVASISRILLMLCGDVESNPGPPPAAMTSLSSEEERWGRLGNGLNTLNRAVQKHLHAKLKVLFNSLPR